MPHEIPERSSNTLDFIQLRIDLKDRLYARGTADAIKAFNLLDNMPGPVMPGEALAQIHASLDEVAEEQVSTLKGQFCSQVDRSYPEGSEEAPAITTPKKYIKEHGLNGMIRPELRQAEAEVISASKQALVKKVQEDMYHESCGTGVDDRDLITAIIEETETKVANVNELADKIKTLMPASTLHFRQIGQSALEGVRDIQGLYDASTTIEGTTYIPPEGANKRAQLDGAIFAIKQALTHLQHGTAAVAQTVGERHQQAVINYLTCALDQHYEALQEEERSRLPQAVVEAYDRVAHIGPSYQPRIKTEEPGEDSAPEERPDIPQACPGISETKFGGIASPFEWHPDDTADLALLSNDTGSVVFSSAMPRNMQAISRDLRANAQVAKKFDDMWSRITEVELHNEAQNHNLITMMRTDFNGLTICYYKNHRHNGLRTYYAKTKLSQFPELAAAMETKGAPRDCNLLILLAETDKEHQPKVWQELGARRRLET